VLEGSSQVDESMLTGEPLPVLRDSRDAALTGWLDQRRRPLVMQVSAVGTDTVLAHIIRLVEDAQAAKAPIQRLVDQVAAVFVPVVLVVALVDLAGLGGGRRRVRAGADPGGGGAGDCLPVCAGPGHTGSHHGRHGRSGEVRHPDQGRAGAGTGPQGGHRGLRQDGHPDAGQPRCCNRCWFRIEGADKDALLKAAASLQSGQ
jgi:hypothetical protein